MGYPQARLVTAARCLEGKVYIGISIELDAAGAKHEARTGVQMLSQIVVTKLATLKEVFLTSIKVVITLIPPVLLGSKARNPFLP